MSGGDSTQSFDVSERVPVCRSFFVLELGRGCDRGSSRSRLGTGKENEDNERPTPWVLERTH